MMRLGVVIVLFLFQSRFESKGLVLLRRVEVNILALLMLRLVDLKKLSICVVVRYVVSGVKD